MGRFETSDAHKSRAPSTAARPDRCKGDVYRAAREMVEDLEGWKIVRADDEAHVLALRAPGRLPGGDRQGHDPRRGAEGSPSSTVHVRSESEGGLLARDRAIVASFVRPFHRRVC